MKDARDLKKDRDKMAKDAEKEVNDSISSMNKQLAQEQQNLRSVTGQEAAHWWKGPGKQDVADARDRVDALKRAVDYMEKNRDAAVKGKADWSQVTQKAYELMGAGPETPTPPPGFKPVP